jgi:hypothetical protein
MENLEGSGTPVLYIGRTVLKGMCFEEAISKLFGRLHFARRCYPVTVLRRQVKILINTFAAIVDLSRFNNSCLRLLKISDDNNE